MDYRLDIPVRGADISYAQENFDFAEAARDGIRFFIIRAGMGVSTDPLLCRNTDGAENVGIPFGFYWHSLALTAEQASAEADVCLKAIKGLKPEYPVFFNAEEILRTDNSDKRRRTDIAAEFCTRILNGGYPCGIYASPASLASSYITDELVPQYDLWLAVWTDNPNKPSVYNYGQTIWQWGTVYVSGKETNGDVCYTDYPAKTKAFYENTVFDKESGEICTDKNLAGCERIRMSDKPQIKNGSLVKIKSGAAAYDGKPLADFMYSQVYTVIQVGTSKLPDYIVIGSGTNVAAAVKASSLIVMRY